MTEKDLIKDLHKIVYEDSPNDSLKAEKVMRLIESIYKTTESHEVKTRCFTLSMTLPLLFRNIVSDYGFSELVHALDFLYNHANITSTLLKNNPDKLTLEQALKLRKNND